jgi:hypothetical protein
MVKTEDMTRAVRATMLKTINSSIFEAQLQLSLSSHVRQKQLMVEQARRAVN